MDRIRYGRYTLMALSMSPGINMWWNESISDGFSLSEEINKIINTKNKEKDKVFIEFPCILKYSEILELEQDLPYSFL